MNAEVTTTSPAPIAYADPKLPVGPTGYRAYAYPADYARMSGEDVTDDGEILRYTPSPFRWAALGRRLLFAAVIVGLYSACVATSAKPVRWPTTIFILAMGAMLVFIAPYLRGAMSRSRRAYVIVDRSRQLIHLPREKRALRYEQVVRLQYVRWQRKYPSLMPAPQLESKMREFQIVFTEADGCEHTWCIIANPNESDVKRFAEKFGAATGIPVAGVSLTNSGEFVAEALDGRSSGEVSETSGRPRGVLG